LSQAAVYFRLFLLITEMLVNIRGVFSLQQSGGYRSFIDNWEHWESNYELLCQSENF
jgi:hypothetical protein